MNSTQDRPRGHSGWLARFFWSPQYCNRQRGSREPQCQPLQGFVLRDLIRVQDGREQEACTQGPMTMSEPILAQILQHTKNRPETRASWRLYGRCSGLGEVNYAAYTELVDRRIYWPDLYRPNGPDVVSDADAVIAAVVAENPGLPAAALRVRCQRSYLESIDVHYADDFTYLLDPAAQRRSDCPGRLRIRGKR